MKAKRASWELSKDSVICFKHFKPVDFARRPDVQEENGISLTPWLKTEVTRGPGRGDTCHLSVFDETLPG